MKSIRLALVAALVTLAFTASTAQAAAPKKLVATVGPGYTISLTMAGKKVKTLKAGRYVITVRDRSNIHNFHIRGAGVNKDSGVRAVGTKTWTVTFKKGTYRYVCDPHASTMKGSFKVT